MDLYGFIWIYILVYICIICMLNSLQKFGELSGFFQQFLNFHQHKNSFRRLCYWTLTDLQEMPDQLKLWQNFDRICKRCQLPEVSAFCRKLSFPRNVEIIWYDFSICQLWNMNEGSRAPIRDRVHRREAPSRAWVSPHPGNAGPARFRRTKSRALGRAARSPRLLFDRVLRLAGEGRAHFLSPSTYLPLSPSKFCKWCFWKFCKMRTQPVII